MTYKCLDTGDDFELPIVNPVPHGWTRVVEIDLTNRDECPVPWRKIKVNNVYMYRSPSDQRGCYTASFSTNGTQYTKIYGMVRGYQKGSTDAFEPYNSHHYTINDPYVDGVSITLSTAPRTHVWTYMLQDSVVVPILLIIFTIVLVLLCRAQIPLPLLFCSSGNPNNNYV